MSKRETPMTHWYWKQVGGTLVEEFPVVRKSKNHAQRFLDGVIIPGDKFRIAHWSDVDLREKDVIIVQAKRGRLGMSLMGQAVFSIELIKPFRPRSVKSVAICEKSDEVLASLLSRYAQVEIVVYEG